MFLEIGDGGVYVVHTPYPQEKEESTFCAADKGNPKGIMNGGK